MTDDGQDRVCACIRLDCWHPKGRCDEPPVYRGGICVSCRFYEAKPEPKEPETCPTCGQPRDGCCTGGQG